MNGTLTPCAVGAVDLAADAGFRLPPRKIKVPNGWLHNQYATELWIERALASHPWRVPDASSADVVVLLANMSLWCVADVGDTRSKLWLTAQRNAPVLRRRVPKALILQYGWCAAPWVGERWRLGGARPPGNDTLLLLDRINPAKKAAQRRSLIVIPFVVSRPPWLAGDAPPPEAPNWADRKLLFFAGHTPKLYVNPTRYQLWRGMRSAPGVTAISSTLSCTVAAFEPCKRGAEWLSAQPLSFFEHRCEMWREILRDLARDRIPSREVVISGATATATSPGCRGRRAGAVLPCRAIHLPNMATASGAGSSGSLGLMCATRASAGSSADASRTAASTIRTSWRL